MKTQRSYFLYKQTFRSPIITSKGAWKERVSWIFREYRKDGRVGFGEYAPVEMPTESQMKEIHKEADKWVDCKSDDLVYKYIRPALCSLKSSIWNLDMDCAQNLKKSARIWGIGKSATVSVIKRKIGMRCPKDEIPIILKWLNELPRDVNVRLDANESFSRVDLQRWTGALEGIPAVQFIEQPVGEFDDEWLLNYAAESPVPIALDESLLRLNNLDTIRHYPNNLFFVVKPILFPDWDLLFATLDQHMKKVIFSTVFESPFGYEALLRLAGRTDQVPGFERSCFYGTKNEFSEHHFQVLRSPSVSNEKLNSLWNALTQ